jgi:hypothetical protein
MWEESTFVELPNAISALAASLSLEKSPCIPPTICGNEQHKSNMSE